LGSIVERRLLTFIVASTAFFLFYFSLRVMFVQPRPPQAANQADPGADVVVDGAEQDDNESPDPVEDANQPAADDVQPDAQPDVQPDSDETEAVPPPERPSRPTWLTLGSMDPNSEYIMLVTLNSQGGGVERIELTERDPGGGFKYRRVDVRNGYLGYFAGEKASEATGVLVNVVGPGTPADIAGVQVGDIIVSVAGRTIETRDHIAEALVSTKPGDTVAVEVLRGDADSPLVLHKLQASLTDHPLDVVRLSRDAGADGIAGNLSRLSCLMTLGQINGRRISTNERSISELEEPGTLIWNAEQQPDGTNDSAEFALELSAAEMKPIGGRPVRLRRSYALAPGSYAIDMSVQIDNLDDEPQELGYRLEGVNGITLEGWWYSTKISPHWSGASARDIVYKTTADGHELISGFELLKRAKKETKDPNQTIFAPDGDDASRNLKYIGIDAQYFTVAYIPPEGSAAFTTFRRAAAGVAATVSEVPRHQERAVNSTFFLDSVTASVPGNGSMRQELRLFAGPKQPDLLEQYALSDCIYYGWFSAFAKILASLLHFLSGVGNYAVAIILLTVIVRGVMFPLSRKAALNAQKMQELAPEMKKINEKYKDDMEGKMKAQRELQQRVGFNPLAGCLPMFLQLPIFIGLYRTLSVDIELRQAAVSSMTDWASNLAGPDMFMFWGDWLWGYLSGRGTGWLGPYFNVLPVLVVVLFLAQQKMFMPPATDEQTAMTQKMMNIMTLMMGLFFFRVPAGLCIYFITSSLWGIGERLFVKKTLPSGKHFDAAVLEGTAVPTEEKTKTIAERIRDQVSKPEAPVQPPNKRRRPKKKK
jgi:YidC/Oxa1 family membrane protein insertase